MSLSDAIGNIVIGSQVFDAQQLLNALHAIGLSIQQTEEGILINGVLVKPDAILDKNVCPLSPVCQQRAHFLSLLRVKTMPTTKNGGSTRHDTEIPLAQATARGYIEDLSRSPSPGMTGVVPTVRNNESMRQESISSPSPNPSKLKDDDVEKFLQRILRPKKHAQPSSKMPGDDWKSDNSGLCSFCFTPRIGHEKYCRTCGEEFY